VRWMVGSTPGRILDLGAGTGRLTERLLADGHRVLAIDPALPMLSRLSGRLEIPVVAGVAEQLPVRDHVFDAVVVGQAFHWFDHQRAVPEIHRVLRPGGVVGLVWNLRDETVPWVRRLGRVVGAKSSTPDPVGALGLHGFGPVDQRRFRLWQRLDRDGLLDLVSSFSNVSLLSADERATVLADIGTLYDSQRGDPLGLSLPYETYCFRATRA
jgi:SAM-dependent methyltransferase